MKDGAFLRAFQALLQTPTLPDLGPGPRAGVQPLPRLKTELDRVSIAMVSTGPGEEDLPVGRFPLARLPWMSPIGSPGSPRNSDGSFHALMHRREPDYSNAKYWFRRVGLHPVFIELARRARELLDRDPSGAAVAAKALPGGKWDPFGFVDLCESVATARPNPEQRQALIELQAIEFEELVIH